MLHNLTLDEPGGLFVCYHIYSALSYVYWSLVCNQNGRCDKKKRRHNKYKKGHATHPHSPVPPTTPHSPNPPQPPIPTS